MKNLKKYIGLCGVAMLSVAAQAQTIATFETEDYAEIGVYDTWVGSPFRTGDLQGNVAVLNNPFLDSETNGTSKVLGVQRSRFGSNTFGVRIDLNETFELTPTTKYVHVMVHKPTEGRVMLIGLGKRQDRPEQSPEVEQFWAYPANDIKVGEWFDAVFSIKGNGGIDIHTLVLVPDCEAPHDMTEDFVAYVDEIVINNNIKPRFGLGAYPVNYALEADWGRSDRKISSVKFNSSNGLQTISIPSNELKGYNKRFETVFKAKPGETVTPSFDYVGTWMHGFVYLDRGNDGEFSSAVDGSNNLNRSTDLVAYSYYKADGTSYGKNSAGNTIYESNNGHNVLNPPAFTIPSDLTPGIYRMRYKVDWNDIDPGGSVRAGNHILENGGGVVDVLLNVHGDQVTVNQDNRNGAVLLASTGEPIDNEVVPFGQPLKIKMQPSNGFEYNGIRVRHGYNLEGDSLIKENPQFRDTYYYANQFASDHTFTIPGDCIDGNVLIEGLFVEEGTGPDPEPEPEPEPEPGPGDDTEYCQPTAVSGRASSENVTSYTNAVFSDDHRAISNIQVSDGTASVDIQGVENVATRPVYYDRTSTVFTTEPGKTITMTTSTYHSNSGWMNTFVYADWNHDGFTTADQVYTNFTGSFQSMALTLNFNVPATLTAGDYRVRYIVDWDQAQGPCYYGQSGQDNAEYVMDFYIKIPGVAGIGDIEIDNSDAPVEYYNLQGIRVDAENIVPGFYIVRQGEKTQKVFINE